MLQRLANLIETRELLSTDALYGVEREGPGTASVLTSRYFNLWSDFHLAR